MDSSRAIVFEMLHCTYISFYPLVFNSKFARSTEKTEVFLRDQASFYWYFELVLPRHVFSCLATRRRVKPAHHYIHSFSYGPLSTPPHMSTTTTQVSVSSDNKSDLTRKGTAKGQFSSTMTPSSRQDVLALKQQLADALGENGPLYWDALKDFVAGKLNRSEFNYYANLYLTQEHGKPWVGARFRATRVYWSQWTV